MFLYGSEVWILSSQQRKRIQAAEIKLLRPLTGSTLQEQIRNEQIRTELEIPNILEIIDDYSAK